MKNNFQKGFANSLIIVIVFLVVAIGGYILFSFQNNEVRIDEELMIDKKEGGEVMEDVENLLMEEDEVMSEEKGGAMMDSRDSMMEKGEETMMEDEIMMSYSGTTIAGKSAPLLDFVKSDYDTAFQSDKLIVLYFFANWCPICKEETENALYPAFNELTDDKVIGFRINYNDNQTDNDEKNMAREFGVAYQHTKVFVKNGKRILKSPEGWDKSRYISEIDKALSIE